MGKKGKLKLMAKLGRPLDMHYWSVHAGMQGLMMVWGRRLRH